MSKTAPKRTAAGAAAMLIAVLYGCSPPAENADKKNTETARNQQGESNHANQQQYPFGDLLDVFETDSIISKFDMQAGEDFYSWYRETMENPDSTDEARKTKLSERINTMARHGQMMDGHFGNLLIDWLEAGREISYDIYYSKERGRYLFIRGIDMQEELRSAMPKLVSTEPLDYQDCRLVKEFISRQVESRQLKTYLLDILSRRCTIGISSGEAKDIELSVQWHLNTSSEFINAGQLMPAFEISGKKYGFLASMHNHNSGEIESSDDLEVSRHYPVIVCAYDGNSNIATARILSGGRMLVSHSFAPKYDFRDYHKKNPMNTIAHPSIEGKRMDYGDGKLVFDVTNPQLVQRILLFDGMRYSAFSPEQDSSHMEIPVPKVPDTLIIISTYGRLSTIKLNQEIRQYEIP